MRYAEQDIRRNVKRNILLLAKFELCVIIKEEQKVKLSIMRVKRMSNIADLIEDYILRQLAAQENGKVELRRTDIADEISCAPSQISYVLSTRFTQDKGFVVESRRGMGGYIRIVQMPVTDLVYQDLAAEIDENTSPAEIKQLIHYLLKRQLISKREAALFLQAAAVAGPKLSAKDRVAFLRSLLMTLANFD